MKPIIKILASTAVLTSALALSSVPALALTAQEEANKKVATEFMAALGSGDIQKAASYLDGNYIQHNPTVATGKQGFLDTFSRMGRPGGGAPGGAPPGGGAPGGAPPGGGARMGGGMGSPAFVVVQGDLVVMVNKRATPEPNDASKTYDAFSFDAFRVKGGKLVEHWDGATKSANGFGGGAPGGAPPGGTR
jgi:predicted SnoaL-like aldol condensation-catalyzing enzyme